MTAQVDLYRELVHSNTCRCGEYKSKMNTFCRTCYAKLPRDRRRALYASIRPPWRRWKMGNGYEEAYATAVEFLDAHNAAEKLKTAAKISALRAQTAH